MAEKIIPHNIEAEQAVIGSMFLTKYAITRCMESLMKDQFYLDAHSKIFDAIKDLAEAGTPVDITTVSNELDRRKELKQIGGVEYLIEITDQVPSASNIDEYIKIVDEKSILRRLIDAATNIETTGYNSTDSLSEVLDKAEATILNVVKTRKGSEFRPIQDVLFKTQANLEKLCQNKGEITGLATGFTELDRLTSGFHENELIIVAARPGMGKTAFALNLATNIAINDRKTVALFNMEMGAEQLATRMLSSVGQIDNNKLRNGTLEHNDWKRVNEAISRLADTNLFIDDTPGMTIGEIRAKCRRLASSEKELGIVIIDYLQLISGPGGKNTNRQQEVSDISRSLKTLAMELKIPVVALAQLSRSVESRDDKRPMLSDLRESGSIEQDADIVGFLYSEAYYNKELAIDNHTVKSQFIVAKHRNGATKDVDLIFKKNTSTFVNYVNNEIE